MTEITREVNLITASILVDKTTSERAKLVVSSNSDDYLGSGSQTGSEGVVRVRVINNVCESLKALKYMRSEISAIDALRVWIYLRKADAPVPDTYQLVQENGVYIGLLMDELTNNWRNILMTTNKTKARNLGQVKRFSPETIDKFCRLNVASLYNRDGLQGNLVGIAERIARQGISFASLDAFAAIFTEYGQLRFMMSDMGNVRKSSTSLIDALAKENFEKMYPFVPDMVSYTQMIARVLK